jgi:hypothetical protein
LTYDDSGNKQYDIAMLSSGSTRRQFDTNAIIQRYEQRIAMTVLADFILIGHTKVGSYALSSNKSSLFQDSLETILQNICDVMNKKAIPDIVKLNGFSVDNYPKLGHDEIEQVDLNALGNYIKKITEAGGLQANGDFELENYLRQVAHLPERPDDLDPIIPNDNYTKEYVEAVQDLRKAIRKEEEENDNKDD